MNPDQMQYFIIDGIAPFFIDCPDRIINWSKIDFTLLETDGQLDSGRCGRIEKAFRTFTRRVAAAGYNTITLDDLAHLCDCAFYPEKLRAKIAAYRAFYRQLFSIAQKNGLKILITTDLLFYNDSIEENIGNRPAAQRAFMRNCCRRIFSEFPEIDGLILRIGESDAADVGGDFRSRLIIRTPRQARAMLRTLLPVFKEFSRLLIFRTWSVGIGPVGDLIWNRHTFDRVFKGIDSEQLVISMKHGESDFFRFLPVNTLFFRSTHRKIVEFQARREYEGFGEFPAFIGREHERCRNELTPAHNLIGMSVWCQSGGWTRFRRLSFLEDRAVWNEINACVILKIFRDGLRADQAVQRFYKERFNDYNWLPLMRLLQLSGEVIRELLYLDEFATRKLFFRRLRVPPLLAVYWSNIVINHPMKKIMRCFVSDGELKIDEGYRALGKISEMRQLAGQLNLPAEDFDFQYDTFRVIAAAREYYFKPFTPELETRLRRIKSEYEARHPEPRYTIHLNFSRFRCSRTNLRLIIRLLFRNRRGYRRFDRIVTLGLLSLLYPLIRRVTRRLFPDFARDHAMGIDSIFR